MTATEEPMARAIRYFQDGDLERAAKVCKRVLKTQPRDANALHLLGVVSYKSGKAKQAVGYFEGAVAGAGPDGELHRNLGFALRDADRPTEAADAVARAFEIDPSDIVARFQLGVLLGGAGAEDEAAGHFAEVLRRDPQNAQAQYNHANALHKAGRLAEALESFARAAAVAPGTARVFFGWAEVLHRSDRWADAVATYKRGMDLDVDWKPADVRVNMGYALREIGQTEEASASFERALAIEPGHGEAIIGQATICDRNGQFDEALSLVRPFLELDEPPVSALLLFAAIAVHFDDGERAADLLRMALERDDLQRDQRLRLCFALGGNCDAAGRYDEAFEHYRSGNALYGGGYDWRPHARGIDELVEAFPAARLAAMPHASVATDLPVFIVGMPRSGTTLVEQILASHALVAGAGELPDIGEMTAALPQALGCGAGYADISAGPGGNGALGTGSRAQRP